MCGQSNSGRLAGDDVGVAQHGLARFPQRRGVALADRDHGVHGVKPGQHRTEQFDQRGVDQHHLVFGFVGDVDDLIGEQADVEGVQNGAHRGHREVRGQVLGVVPHERRHPLVTGHPEATQPIGQLGGLAAHFPIARRAVAIPGGGGHRAVPVDTAAVAHDRGDRQRIVLHRAVHRCTALFSARHCPCQSAKCAARIPGRRRSAADRFPTLSPNSAIVAKITRANERRRGSRSAGGALEATRFRRPLPLSVRTGI